MSGVGQAVGAVVGTVIAPGIGTVIGSYIGGLTDGAINKNKDKGSSAPEAPKPVEQYETQQEAVRSKMRRTGVGVLFQIPLLPLEGLEQVA